MAVDSVPLAAVVTGPGPGAIGVIEVHGPGALAAVAALFRPHGAGADLGSGALVYGTLADDRGPIDEVLVCVRPGAASWTGEPVVEVHGHGSPAALEAALEALERRGVRRAAPRDLLERASATGRLGRIRLEALEALARARTLPAARAFLDQLHGALAGAVRELLTPEADPAALGRRLDDLLATARFGLALSAPPHVVLAGAANAGKSTLFNALVGADRAIVHPSPGTTRDPVDEVIAPEGIPLRLVDTAGLRGGGAPAAGSVEAASLAATAEAAGSADLVLVVVDAAGPTPPEVRAFAEALRRPSAWVFNKIDLLPAGARPHAAPDGSRHLFFVSAREAWGVAELARALPALAGMPPAPAPGSACVFTARQRDALAAARAALPDAARARERLARFLAGG